tara:strand:+ start:334 stop:492 length:159 start_codon:yes stop_codon:yes gene_type:complete
MQKTEKLRIEGVIEILEICANLDDLTLRNKNMLIMDSAKILSEVIAPHQLQE